MTQLSQQQAKEIAGRAGAALVKDGMRVGLGTGSTVHFTLVALGEGKPDIRCVATSSGTEKLAAQEGLVVVSPGTLGELDIGIDGADEIDKNLNLIKGGGGALTREKVVAAMCQRWIVVADDSKLVTTLGKHPLPIEVVDFAADIVAKRLKDLGAQQIDRRPSLSDNGNPILDAHFGVIDDPAALSRTLDAMPGIVEHGIFLSELVDTVLVGKPDGRVTEFGRHSSR